MPCVIEAVIVDDSGIFDPTVLFRLKGGAAFDRVPMKSSTAKPGTFQAVIPAAVVAAGDVEYLIEAFDVEGNGPARAGTEAGPLLLQHKVALAFGEPPVGTASVEDNTGLVIGLVVGVASAVAIGVGIGVAVFALRSPAVAVIAVNVQGPSPIAALLQ